MTKRAKLLLALLAALVTAVSAAGDKVLPLLEQVIAAFGEEPNPEVAPGTLPLPTGGFAGSLADEVDAGSVSDAGV